MIGERTLHLARCVLLAATLAAAGLQHAGAQGLGTKFDPRRDAVADVAQAVARAGAEGKRVIVDVGGEWCTWCHVMEKFIATNEDVRTLIATDFVWVKVSYSPANRNERLLSGWPKVTGYPHLFVLDAAGKVVRSQPSAELEAARDYDKAKMLAFLQASRPAR
jgi:thioredoxin-related protein